MDIEPIAPEGSHAHNGIESEVYPETRIAEEHRNGQSFGEARGRDASGADEHPAQTQSVVVGPGRIPTSAAWFNIDRINRIERDMLPEFFKGGKPSKTPDVYMKYRNFMIALYRMNPKNYLSATTCRRNLVGCAD